MPSAFTPNHDGSNDLCRPKIYGKFTRYHFTIFNRWGQKVFDTTQINAGWDGTMAGQIASAQLLMFGCVLFSLKENLHGLKKVLLF